MKRDLGQPAAFKRREAAEYLNISTSTLSRIGPAADIAQGRVRLWRQQTLDGWLAGLNKRGGRRK
jgi:hypothetical protein